MVRVAMCECVVFVYNYIYSWLYKQLCIIKHHIQLLYAIKIEKVIAIILKIIGPWVQ